ncbi:auxin efflux carrier component 1b-related [Anaeramoeba flamelloides]|uniref:Auxin efflux carrier component 1b-related n=1 Tax=Anaeramoeba flamelloides TaxID=1746091 RepID=A0AAV7ZYR3_9EUKA|nr:auxin efflux carrier component 1b-related [Anaeramoeba flamelloides]KAJ6237689.1 auxin efflux carrier component 1b-related [Anaeramoeba flamelloides]
MLVIYGKSFLIYTILASVPNWFVQIPLYIFLCEKLKAQRELEGAKAITDPDEEHLLSEDTNFDENDDKSNSESSRGGESEGATGRNINGETTQNTHSDENMIDESTLLINNQTTKNGSEGKKHRKNYSNKSFRSKVLKLTLIKVSKNTLLIGVVLGTIYSLTGLYVPDVITQFYGYLGSVTLPVAMLTIGMFCYREKIIACDWKLALLIAIIKLFIYPLACYGFQMIFDIKGAPGKAMFLINALPPALATFSFGEE